MTRVVYAARPWVVGLFAAGAAGFWTLAARTPFPGRFLFLVAAAATSYETVRCGLLRPTLRADGNGIEVLTGVRRQRVRWDDVEDVTTLRPPTQGGGLRRNANALEVDLGDRLIVVPAYRLGTSGETAAAALASIRRAT